MEALRAAARSRSARPSSERTRERTLRDEGYGTQWDETFAYIVGRTEAGFPFGVTWEELESPEPSPPPPESADEDHAPRQAGGAGAHHEDPRGAVRVTRSPDPDAARRRESIAPLGANIQGPARIYMSEKV
jgi:hypothetical protein